MVGEQVRILVVDDEVAVRLVLQRMLEELGYHVVTAANGQEALDKMSQLNIGVALLDIKMPGMSGMEVLQQITTSWPGTCVLMVTAVADTKTTVEAMKLGAYDYITKPFKRDNVARKVQEAISKWRHQLQEKR
jgi:DNA-binding NtrC family response regulator